LDHGPVQVARKQSGGEAVQAVERQEHVCFAQTGFITDGKLAKDHVKPRIRGLDEIGACVGSTKEWTNRVDGCERTRHLGRFLKGAEGRRHIRRLRTRRSPPHSLDRSNKAIVLALAPGAQIRLVTESSIRPP
jgi:hypothetical protein